MAAWADAHPVRFVVSTGDNFYEDGVASVTDPTWKASFEDVYSAPSLLQVPWIVALGNHDYRGNVDAQIEYSKSSSRWRMPARSFTVTGDRRRRDARPALRPRHDAVPRRPIARSSRARRSPGRTRGPTRLARDGAGGVDGRLEGRRRAPPDLLVRAARRLGRARPRRPPDLRRAPTSRVYLNGHDHGLQHLESGGIHFVTSGAGSEFTRVSPDARTRWAEATGGFVALAASARRFSSERSSASAPSATKP